MSKIQKESKSQRYGDYDGLACWCCDACQRYKKKANHNAAERLVYLAIGVVMHVKDTKRKQITTSWYSGSSGSGCCDACQRYKKKANHNIFN